MPCTDYGAGVIVCTSGAYLRRRSGCPVCKIADASIVEKISGNPYFGSDFTCTACGDSWGDGYLHGRPFRRGWRQAAITQAVAEWEAACECPVDRDDDLYALPCIHQGA